jgi:ABC-2 type transport system permease protein
MLFLGTTVLGFSLPLLSLFYSLSAFSEDREDGTLIYLLVRPVPRTSLFAGKLLGALVAAGALAVLFTVGLDAATRMVLGSSPLARALYLRLLGVLLIGTGCYAALYAALSMALKRPAIVCLFHAFIWESFLPNAQGQLPNLTFSHNLKALLVGWAPELRGIVAQPRIVLPEASDAGVFLAVVVGAALIGGATLFCTREWEKRAEG